MSGFTFAAIVMCSMTLMVTREPDKNDGEEEVTREVPVPMEMEPEDVKPEDMIHVQPAD